MMKTRKNFLAMGSILSLLLAGCTMPAASGAGPRAWIDSPLNGSTLPLEPVVVRSHSASESGTASAALYVDGAQVRLDNVADPSARLVEIQQVWQPTAPGYYVLQVIATDGSGNAGPSASVRVRIGEVSNSTPIEGGQSPEPLDTPETRIPETLQPASPPPSIPTFTFTTNANCREGPGTAYEVDTSFFQGQSVQVDGRSQTDPRWWWVLIPSGGHCWVSDITGVASGPFEGVQVVAAPPLPPTSVPLPPTSIPPVLATAPAAPGNLNVVTICKYGSPFTVTLGWKDKANNELGYRVYRNDVLIATLGANATSYIDSPPGSGPYTYKVEAYNNAGASSRSVPDVVCFT